MGEAVEAAQSRVAVIGAGAIGVAFAAVFGDAGASVVVAEPDGARRDGLAGALASHHAAMVTAGLAREETPAEVNSVAAAGDAAAGADLVIEAGPEDLSAKQNLFDTLLEASEGHPAPVPIATASSAITVSRILPEAHRRARCLVAHPANPPSVIRILEIVPAPETDPAVTARTAELFTSAGFSPTILNGEIEGFVFNRLQGALLREAYRLVADGLVDAGGVDRLVRDGLGPRWALSGPFETAELNTPGGLLAHAARMGPAYKRMGEARGETDAGWPDDLVRTVERQRRAAVPAEALPAKARWRARAVAQLIKARNAIAKDGGDG
ncbi:MAG: 3-hydroxyacyl-CoA dehydrogenase NAD-binding domain-containing protein [Pseudomonadota bacterium]